MMKIIENFRSGTVADIESDDLLDGATKIHVLSYKMLNGKIKSIRGSDHKSLKKFLKYHLINKIPLVGHNFICFDIPLLEKILKINLKKLMVIDTITLSYYLNNKRKRHGLDSFLADYGIAKPKVTDWQGLPYEEYRHRCQEDVAINSKLWEDFLERMTGMYSLAKTHIDNGDTDGVRLNTSEVQNIDSLKGKSVDQLICNCLNNLMLKSDMARLQEKTRWKADKPHFEVELAELNDLIRPAQKELQEVMPKVPKYSKRNKPAKPFLKSGELSTSGSNWNELVKSLGVKDKWGNPLTIKTDSPEVLKTIASYADSNINSPQQIKAFLYSHGWKPRSYKFTKDKKYQEAMNAWAAAGYKKGKRPVARGVAQINVDKGDGKELCESVTMLADKAPEILAYSKYTVIKHRYDTIAGMLKNISDDGYLKARMQGFTNTLRVKHTELVNLPGYDKPYAKGIRSGLTCLDNEILLGSDLSSLEDRVKHHFALTIDPKYVNKVNIRGYDPHIEMAHTAGMITNKQFEDFMLVAVKEKDFEDKLIKEGEFKKFASMFDLSVQKNKRRLGKTTNYAAVYGAFPKTISESAGITLDEGQALFDAYWKIHSYVKKIAESQCVIKIVDGTSWLINPINAMMYSIRSEKDIFSTLIQGTGAFLFDMWIDNILQGMEERFGVRRLSGTFHDEFIVAFKDSAKNREEMRDITNKALDKVNKRYILRRELGCGVDFGKKYSEIH